MAMPKAGEELSFYDVKGKKKFKSKQWKTVNKKGRKFAVAKAPSGIDAYRILGKA
jgi:predicted AlkP superfamily phosphohydrolase/phosphomutase